MLNSWALLEKHIHHAHLHPNATGMPAPGKPVECKVGACDKVFGTGAECYQHCLSAHMAPYGARCPFSECFTIVIVEGTCSDQQTVLLKVSEVHPSTLCWLMLAAGIVPLLRTTLSRVSFTTSHQTFLQLPLFPSCRTAPCPLHLRSQHRQDRSSHPSP